MLVGSIWSVTIGISWSAVVLAFSISAFTGVFFGFYPALKASRLDPIEALRYH
jgi:putative ABC transport system permease protein